MIPVAEVARLWTMRQPIQTLASTATARRQHVQTLASSATVWRQPIQTLASSATAMSLLLVLLLAGCGSQTSSESTTVVLTGSSTVAPLMSEIGKRFEQTHPGVRVDVQSGGSSRGVADVRRGLADIGMVSRALKADEQELHAVTIARDGIGMIVHRDNPVAVLTDAQIVDIFTGQVQNWNEVGGNDAPITVVNKAEGRSTLELFLQHFELDNQAVQADVVIGDNEQGVKTVAGNPHAIGYVSIGTAEYDAAAGVPIRLLPLGGVEASIANVQNGSFPLSRPLNLVFREQDAPLPQGLAGALVEFARSPAMHATIKEQYFVPLSP
ncbi:phosphate ABC transporter substrate-binding protein [Roseimaritima ulvae]|uniref:Phosphate-binding protein PstS 1 n=1 Tax=Roseimaritima ulvae TaxID=980254 RepID=A0A5B9QKL3_9BACT|nr:phosphate ABC transporter substrate-binding protein [Roseimaritima ulvae]QEG39608.1 Phosphate-binding protein PstS 1 precursor [Roseimaritima ulvae]